MPARNTERTPKRTHPRKFSRMTLPKIDGKTGKTHVGRDGNGPPTRGKRKTNCRAP